MTTRIRKVAVLGAGVMGSGIAAHLANAGIPRAPPRHRPAQGRPGRTPRARRPQQVRARRAREPAQGEARAVLHPTRRSSCIEVGNLEDDLAARRRVRLVIEVVKEDLAVKQALFAQASSRCSRRTPIVASNTSGLSIERHDWKGRRRRRSRSASS